MFRKKDRKGNSIQMQYFYYVNGSQYGPVSLDILRQRGITSDTLVWREGLSTWVKAGELPELSSLFLNNNASGQPPFPQQSYTQYNNASSAQSYNTLQNKPIKPENYLVWAILSTIFCFFPFGIVAIVMAAGVDDAYNRGDYEAAQQKSKKARMWAMWSALTNVIVLVVYLIVIFFTVSGVALFGAANL